MENRQQLIEDNINLVYFVIHKDFPRYITDEDLVQVGMLGLCKAANSWDEAKGSFSCFAVHYIRGEILKEFRSRKRHKPSLSLDYVYGETDDESSTLGSVLVGDQDVDWFDEQGLYDVLLDSERVVVDMALQGLNQREIADQLGVTKQSISSRLRRAKKRWEKTNDY